LFILCCSARFLFTIRSLEVLPGIFCTVFLLLMPGLPGLRPQVGTSAI
jgi:hypothetical protein